MRAKKHNRLSEKESPHIPVLLEQCLHYLAPKRGQSYLDLTAGYGGHASLVLESTLQAQKATLVDRDQNAIDFLSQRFAGSEVEILHSDFLSASHRLSTEKRRYDMILADLGVSSPQLGSGSRGFSFQTDGPLDMRMDQQGKISADTIINNYREDELAKLISDYGEEPKAHRIAHDIVKARPVSSTTQLATIVAKTLGAKSKIHPATRTFQAVRIAVNQELTQLADGLPLWVDLLAPSGRLVVISFHSLEDRMVKRFFAEKSIGYEAELKVLTKRPITGNASETVFNPRARSAKLRAVVKIK